MLLWHSIEESEHRLVVALHIPAYSTGLARPRWVPTEAVRRTVAAQLEALRILIAKMRVSPGRIPALG
jgi:hypothetical protein